MSRLQIIIIITFVVIAVVAVLIFGGFLPGFKGKGAQGKGARISVWGFFDSSDLRNLIVDLNNANRDYFNVNYEEKDKDAYVENIIDNLAAGRGPDAWFISQESILKFRDKVAFLPFQSFDERSFRDTFVDYSDLFLEPNKGIMGIPVAVDPIILYWNKDLFSSAEIAAPPRYWDEFLEDVQKIVRRDEAGEIEVAGAAMGEFRNIKNAKGILSMLFLQTGNKIVDPVKLKAVVSARKRGTQFSPIANALGFFNDFSNPIKSSYTWNRSLPLDRDMFVDGRLGMYFGYASEYFEIKKKNPHLNFDIAVVPQIRPSGTGESGLKITYGKIYSIVVSKLSRHKQSAFSFASALSSPKFQEEFVKSVSMAPARRDLLSRGDLDPAFAVFYKSAIITRSWLEPEVRGVGEIFQEAVEMTSTGKVNLDEAVNVIQRKLDELLRKFKK